MEEEAAYWFVKSAKHLSIGLFLDDSLVIEQMSGYFS